MTDVFEGKLLTVGTDRTSALQLQADFDTLRPKHRAMIKKVATECNEYGHSISFDQMKSHRRYCIGRGLVDLAMSDNFDEHLIRGVCFAVTGYIMNTAGGAVGHLCAQEAQQFRTICLDIRNDQADINWLAEEEIFGFPKLQKAGK